MSQTPFDDDDPRIAHNRVWFNLARIQRSIAPRIARALEAIGIEDPIWYEILLEVERAGPGGLRMAELEGRLFLPQYALSRHVSRLSAAGFLRSDPRPGSGRARQLYLTPEAMGLHDRIWPAYMEAIQTEFAHRLTVDEAYDLSRLLIRLYP
ncbi:MarR family winged helix-turn-helix transcriptional regulator [Falsirhodobacter xinxiangensis]|uniref:MarR family winged helix-turn-helix transcriptional regulator n=1 Tax=Falsirhodobacter xinxiangensis TaxID=2530049 RepID=UPI001FE6927C|nr:MarR family transcriptional regulator [Rhodobacter xinxiangensis]